MKRQKPEQRIITATKDTWTRTWQIKEGKPAQLSLRLIWRIKDDVYAEATKPQADHMNVVQHEIKEPGNKINMKPVVEHET